MYAIVKQNLVIRVVAQIPGNNVHPFPADWVFVPIPQGVPVAEDWLYNNGQFYPPGSIIGG